MRQEERRETKNEHRQSAFLIFPSYSYSYTMVICTLFYPQEQQMNNLQIMTLSTLGPQNYKNIFG